MKPFDPQVFFNDVPVEHSVSQKPLGLHLDQKLDFSKHNKKISHKKEYQSSENLFLGNNILPRNALLTICKSFVRPHLDYGKYRIRSTKQPEFFEENRSGSV